MVMMSAARAVSAAATSLLAFGALVGCTSGQEVQEAPGGVSFAEQLEIERDGATSDFEREVLDRAVETGEIAAADYEEAVSRYLECTTAAGYTIETIKQPNGIYRWQPINVTDDQAYLDDTYVCAEGTTMIIEALYKLQVVNPDGLDLASAAIACLVENGVVDGSYTVEEFNQDAPDGFEDAPFDATDQLAVMCLTSLGFGIAG